MGSEKNILLCVSGFTPAIITETLWCLTQGYNSENTKFKVDEIHVITTTDGYREIEQKLFRSGKFEQFKEHYPECSQIKFNDRCIHLLTNDKNRKPEMTDSEEIQFKDVKTGPENECAANQIYLVLKDLVGKSTRIHASAAGGRKTMSIYLTVMMQLLARAEDTLSHVVTWDRFGENNNFFYPEPKDVTSENTLPISLAFIPFIRLREAGVTFIDELTTGENSYSEAVQRVKRNLKMAEAGEKLVLNLKDSTVGVSDHKTKISGTRMLIMLIYALSPGKAISDKELTMEIFDEAFYNLCGRKFRYANSSEDLIDMLPNKAAIDDALNTLETTIVKLLNSGKSEHWEELLKRMREWRSRINNQVLRDKIGLSKKYFIRNKGGYNEAAYGFDVSVEIIM